MSASFIVAPGKIGVGEIPKVPDSGSVINSSSFSQCSVITEEHVFSSDINADRVRSLLRMRNYVYALHSGSVVSMPPTVGAILRLRTRAKIGVPVIKTVMVSVIGSTESGYKSVHENGSRRVRGSSDRVPNHPNASSRPLYVGQGRVSESGNNSHFSLSKTYIPAFLPVDGEQFFGDRCFLRIGLSSSMFSRLGTNFTVGHDRPPKSIVRSGRTSILYRDNFKGDTP